MLVPLEKPNHDVSFAGRQYSPDKLAAIQERKLKEWKVKTFDELDKILEQRIRECCRILNKTATFGLNPSIFGNEVTRYDEAPDFMFTEAHNGLRKVLSKIFYASPYAKEYYKDYLDAYVEDGKLTKDYREI